MQHTLPSCHYIDCYVGYTFGNFKLSVTEFFLTGYFHINTIHFRLEYQRVNNENMLSRKELRVIYSVMNLACNCGCVPCDFSYTKVRTELDLRFARSKFKLVYCCFNFILSIFNSLYAAIRLSLSSLQVSKHVAVSCWGFSPLFLVHNYSGLPSYF